MIKDLATGKVNGTVSLVKHKCSKIMSIPKAVFNPDTNNTCEIQYVEEKVSGDCKYPAISNSQIIQTVLRCLSSRGPMKNR